MMICNAYVKSDGTVVGYRHSITTCYTRPDGRIVGRKTETSSVFESDDKSKSNGE